MHLAPQLPVEDVAPPPELSSHKMQQKTRTHAMDGYRIQLLLGAYAKASKKKLVSYLQDRYVTMVLNDATWRGVSRGNILSRSSQSVPHVSSQKLSPSVVTGPWISQAARGHQPPNSQLIAFTRFYRED